MDQNELYHYGVLGMKWGVHRGRVAQAYSKGMNKQHKLDVKVSKAKSAYQKADTAMYKANKYKSRAEKRQIKALRKEKKYIKAQRKADKWARSMDKTFRKQNITQLNREHVNSGKDFIKRTL